MPPSFIGDIMDRQQMELDAFEKAALELVFGKNYESNQKYMIVSKFFPNVIQQRIDSFESFIRPLMDEDGKIDGTMLKTLATGKFASLNSIIPNAPFYLSDVSSALKLIFLGEQK